MVNLKTSVDYATVADALPALFEKVMHGRALWSKARAYVKEQDVACNVAQLAKDTCERSLMAMNDRCSLTDRSASIDVCYSDLASTIETLAA
eukprot:6280300-Pyramimonas_sp.AAC.1